MSISSLIAPATLSVEPIVRNSTVMMNVPSPGISNCQKSFRFGKNRTQQFLKPRTVLTQRAVATAFSGQKLRFLPIRSLFTNESYQIQFSGSTVTCEDENATISRALDNVKEQKDHILDHSIVEVSIHTLLLSQISAVQHQFRQQIFQIPGLKNEFRGYFPKVTNLSRVRVPFLGILARSDFRIHTFLIYLRQSRLLFFF